MPGRTHDATMLLYSYAPSKSQLELARLPQQELVRRIRSNLLSNYVLLGQRMILGVFSFRLLYTHLDSQEFGYWALLWSVFGYGILLDFGFGLTVQKGVAQLSAHASWDELNSLLSTIYFTYWAIGALLALGGWLTADYWVCVVGVSPERQPEFARAFSLFVTAMGLMFPLGVFDGVLRGLQRIALKNALDMVFGVVSFGGIVWALRTGRSLSVILLVSLSAIVGSSLVASYFASKYLPTLRLRPGLVSRGQLKAATSFSFVAYFIMLSYVVMNKIDLMVISSMMAVAAVSVYQPGAKVAELFASLTKQLASVLQPAAAHLYAKGTRADVAALLTKGIRYSALLSTPAYLGSAFYLDVVLRVLTGEKQASREMVWVGQALLLWSYSFIITHSIYKGVAVMGGHERKLMMIGLVEAGLKLGLSVLSVLLFRSVFGVAVGTLVPAVVIGWGILWGWSAAEAGLSRFDLWKRTLLPVWTANAPLLAWLGVLKLTGWTAWSCGYRALITGMVGSMVLGLVLTWRLGLPAEERQRLAGLLVRWKTVG